MREKRRFCRQRVGVDYPVKCNPVLEHDALESLIRRYSDTDRTIFCKWLKGVGLTQIAVQENKDVNEVWEIIQRLCSSVEKSSPRLNPRRKRRT